MYRVTTPEHVFKLPEDASVYEVIQITYKQGSTKLVKLCDDGSVPSGVRIIDDTVIVTLTQAETKKFRRGELTVQVRALKNNGKAYASTRFPIAVEEVNNEEILK